jgi:hypothetical protein
VVQLIRIGTTGIFRLPDGLFFGKTNIRLYVDGSLADDNVKIISDNEVDVFNVKENTIVEIKA